jgi:hypothetical protein
VGGRAGERAPLPGLRPALLAAPGADLALYLLDNGLTRDELRWFMSHGLDGRIVMGNDFYVNNEQVVAWPFR